MRVVGVVAGLVLLGVSCLEPTQVELVITTDICDLTNVSIYFDDPAQPVATIPRKLGCPKNLGSLVFVPSNRGKTFTVHVDGSRQADMGCTTNCVQTSRSVSYVTHASLTLPIELENACVNMKCPAGQTCRRGKCVDADAKCDLMPKLCDVLEDGGKPSLDASIDGPDPKTCMNIGASGAIMGIPPATHSWTFDEITDFKDGIGTSDVNLASGYSRMPVDGRCRGGLGLASTNLLMPLGSMPQATTGAGVGVVMDLRVPPMGGSFTLVGANPGMNYGWQIVGVDTNGSWVLGLVVTNGVTGTATSKVPTMADGNWHHIEVFGKGLVVTFLVDNGTPEPVAITPQAMIPTGSLPLALTGSAPNVAIDNLWIYPSR